MVGRLEMFDGCSFAFSDEATRRLPMYDGLSNVSILRLGTVASSQERRTDARICYPVNRVPDAVQHFLDAYPQTQKNEY